MPLFYPSLAFTGNQLDRTKDCKNQDPITIVITDTWCVWCSVLPRLRPITLGPG